VDRQNRGGAPHGPPPLSWWWVVTALAAALIIGGSALVALWQLARPLAVLILGISIAASLAPFVERLSRRVPRAVAVVSVYVLLAVVLVVIGWVVVPPLARQVRGVSDNLPALISRVQSIVNQWDQLSDGSLVGALLSQLGQLGARLVSLPFAVASSVFDILLVVFISIYWLLLAPSMERFVLSLFPEGQREGVGQLINDMGAAMGGYLRGAVINGLIVGMLVYIGMLVIGVDYALVLGLIAAVLEVVPVIGPIISGTIIVVTALLQSPTKALIALGFVIIMQQAENNLLVPNIMRSQTNISPLLGILAIFVGGAVGGLLGAIIAIPVAAALRVFVLQVIAPAIRRQTGAEVIES
jgi:predicted PurR-regulated permease PerM